MITKTRGMKISPKIPYIIYLHTALKFTYICSLLDILPQIERNLNTPHQKYAMQTFFTPTVFWYYRKMIYYPFICQHEF